jgi:four helix bundle protein
MSQVTKESIIAKKSYSFALEIIKLTKLLPKTYENIVLIKQIIRSATSIGANIEEALGSNSKKEFIHCMNISKKEARETIYWLRLISDVNLEFKIKTEILIKENDEIIRILTKIVKTSSL